MNPYNGIHFFIKIFYDKFLIYIKNFQVLLINFIYILFFLKVSYPLLIKYRYDNALDVLPLPSLKG